MIEKVMKENDWYDAVVIIDNLYSSTEVDISTPEVKDVLRDIDRIRGFEILILNRSFRRKGRR